MSGLNKWKQIFQRLSTPATPRAERKSAFGIAAEFGVEAPLTPALIKNISTSGVYLITKKRLPENELVTLVLREEGAQENGTDAEFAIHARVSREGEDGIGLSFVLPPGMDTDFWEVLVRNISSLTEPTQIAGMFRTLRAILFLCRLCPSGAAETIRLIGGQLTQDRVENLIRIMLATEKKLAREPGFGRMHAHPKLTANLLREGSWTPDETVIELWAGLLAASCTVDEPDESNQVFVDVLLHVASAQARIFSHGCQRALKEGEQPESSPSSRIILSGEELLALTGVQDIYRDATTVAYMFNLGLVQKLPNVNTYDFLEKIDITPTNLGLELYKRCHGYRGRIDNQLILTAYKHLRDLLPGPTPTNLE